jgi:hypothetical protein
MLSARLTTEPLPRSDPGIVDPEPHDAGFHRHLRREEQCIRPDTDRPERFGEPC